MQAQQSVKIMSVLNDAGQEPQALYVGGCVRNAVIGQPVADIDIATSLTPEAVQERCVAAGIKTIPTGIDHGTVTALVDGKVYEITTLRRDVSTDGRRATVAFSGSWGEDAQRRDFTMNTLLADGKGGIYDLTGRGIDDLKAGRVIFVGDPDKRIEEDYLRILRFFRFHALYGQGAPDVAALKACAAAASHIATLSRERITQEFVKILMSGHAAGTLDLMFAHGICADLPATDYNTSDMERLMIFQQRYAQPDIVLRLYMLFQSDAGIERGATYLLYTNRQKKDLKALDRLWQAQPASPPKHLIYLHGKEAAARLFILRAVKSDVSSLEEAMDLIAAWDVPVLPVNGDDAAAAGIAQGPGIGHALKQVEAWWIEHDFAPDRAACLEYLKDNLTA